MRRLMIVGTAFLAALSIASGTHPQTAPSPCGNSDFVDGAIEKGVEPYRVAITGRAYFRRDGENCPGAIACQLKSYVVGKNTVLVSKIEHGWACAWYGGTAGDTVGWLRVADLAKTATPSAKITWVGNWSVGESSSILISRDVHGGLLVEGETVNLARPSKPSGGFSGELLVNGAAALYSDFDAKADARFKAQFPGEPTPDSCTVAFRRVDLYLLASETTTACAGMGASFSGVYRRQRR